MNTDVVGYLTLMTNNDMVYRLRGAAPNDLEGYALSSAGGGGPGCLAWIMDSSW